jgi:hypothetical protein
VRPRAHDPYRRIPPDVYLADLTRHEDAFSYSVGWAALDDLIDAGVMDQPVRGLPDRLVAECTVEARALLAAHSGLTPLRACELAISAVYQRHKYVPTWNSYAFPERQVAERL